MTLVRYEVARDVAVITVDNPPVNALSPGAVSYTHLKLPTKRIV